MKGLLLHCILGGSSGILCSSSSILGCIDSLAGGLCGGFRSIGSGGGGGRRSSVSRFGRVGGGRRSSVSGFGSIDGRCGRGSSRSRGFSFWSFHRLRFFFLGACSNCHCEHGSDEERLFH